MIRKVRKAFSEDVMVQAPTVNRFADDEPKNPFEDRGTSDFADRKGNPAFTQFKDVFEPTPDPIEAAAKNVIQTDSSDVKTGAAAAINQKISDNYMPDDEQEKVSAIRRRMESPVESPVINEAPQITRISSEEDATKSAASAIQNTGAAVKEAVSEVDSSVRSDALKFERFYDNSVKPITPAAPPPPPVVVESPPPPQNITREIEDERDRGGSRRIVNQPIQEVAAPPVVVEPPPPPPPPPPQPEPIVEAQPQPQPQPQPEIIAPIRTQPRRAIIEDERDISAKPIVDRPIERIPIEEVVTPVEPEPAPPKYVNINAPELRVNPPVEEKQPPINSPIIGGIPNFDYDRLQEFLAAFNAAKEKGDKEFEWDGVKYPTGVEGPPPKEVTPESPVVTPPDQRIEEPPKEVTPESPVVTPGTPPTGTPPTETPPTGTPPTGTPPVSDKPAPKKPSFPLLSVTNFLSRALTGKSYKEETPEETTTTKSSAQGLAVSSSSVQSVTPEKSFALAPTSSQSVILQGTEGILKNQAENASLSSPMTIAQSQQPVVINNTTVMPTPSPTNKTKDVFSDDSTFTRLSSMDVHHPSGFAGYR